MYCCEYCFCDSYIKEIIVKKAMKGKCEFCGSDSDKGPVHVIETSDLKPYFQPLMNLHTEQVNIMLIEELKKCEGRHIWDILSEDWEIFDTPEKGKKIIADMYSDGGAPFILEHYVEDEYDFFGLNEENSRKLITEWDKFSLEIKEKNRFFPEKIFDLKDLQVSLELFEEKISKEEPLYRARIWDNCEGYYIESMGAPPKEKAIHGRANPAGIPYLYLASDEKTAIYEVRARLSEKISVGEFYLTKDLNVIDLREPKIVSPFRWGDKLREILGNLPFLQKLGKILTEPVNPDEASLQYLPTQYLCEFIKKKGYDGVLYKSNYTSDGYNIVLFQPSAAECKKVFNRSITNIQYD